MNGDITELKEELNMSEPIIVNRLTTVETVQTESHIEYDKEAIMKLMKEDIIRRGYKISAGRDIEFNAGYKLVRDEWGFSSGMQSYFEGANVAVIKMEEEE